MMCSRMRDFGDHRRRWRFIFGIPFILGFLALGGLVLMLLWNSILTDLFNFKMISFWQSIGLMIISKLLFVGFQHRHRPYYYDRRHLAKLKHWYDEHMPEEKESQESEGKE